MKKQLLNEPDIFELITKMQEQLTAMDRKMDVVMSKIASQSIAARPTPQPTFQPPKPMHAQAQGNGRPYDQRQARPVYRATCADCQKECELPFKPTGDRPVYCKECFAKRRAGNAVKVSPVNKPQAAPVVQTVIPAAVKVQEPPAKKKQKTAIAKKPAAKKKPLAKKKK